MSAKLMGQVWELELNHGEQAVMLALADHGEDDGSQIFPSVARLAWKTGYKERQVQNILRALEEKRLIIPVAYLQGGRGKATEYQMCIENGIRKPPFKSTKRVQSVTHTEDQKDAKEKRVQSASKRVQKPTRKGAITIAPQPSCTTVIEPSIPDNEWMEEGRPDEMSKEPVLSPSKPLRYKLVDWLDYFGKLGGRGSNLHTLAARAERDKVTPDDVDRLIGQAQEAAGQQGQEIRNPVGFIFVNVITYERGWNFGAYPPSALNNQMRPVKSSNAATGYSARRLDPPAAPRPLPFPTDDTVPGSLPPEQRQALRAASRREAQERLNGRTV